MPVIVHDDGGPAPDPLPPSPPPDSSVSIVAPPPDQRPIPRPGQTIIDVGDGSYVIVEPSGQTAPATPPPTQPPPPPPVEPPPEPPPAPDVTPPPAPDDSYDDDPDAEAGPQPTDADYAQLDAERVAIERGDRLPASSSHPPAGTLIGLPYEGTHSVAFNRAGGSDNWQSENAVDVWLWPGTAILAVADGTISPGGYGYGLSNEGGRFAGWRLHLITDDGRAFFYTHMAGLEVLKGAHVHAGEIIGRSGIANGVPHLHFAARPPFDPRAYYKAAFSLGVPTSIGASPTTGGPTDINDQGVLDAWNELMIVHGRTVPAATAHIRDARQQLGTSVS